MKKRCFFCGEPLSRDEKERNICKNCMVSIFINDELKLNKKLEQT